MVTQVMEKNFKGSKLKNGTKWHSIASTIRSPPMPSAQLKTSQTSGHFRTKSSGIFFHWHVTSASFLFLFLISCLFVCLFCFAFALLAFILLFVCYCIFIYFSGCPPSVQLVYLLFSVFAHFPCLLICIRKFVLSVFSPSQRLHIADT